MTPVIVYAKGPAWFEFKVISNQSPSFTLATDLVNEYVAGVREVSLISTVVLAKPFSSVIVKVSAPSVVVSDVDEKVSTLPLATVPVRLAPLMSAEVTPVIVYPKEPV